LNLSELDIHTKAIIQGFSDSNWEVVLLEHGFSAGKEVSVEFHAPFNGPIAVRLGETLISMRRDEAKTVLIEKA
jgi:ferrous iron transport protein A